MLRSLRAFDTCAVPQDMRGQVTIAASLSSAIILLLFGILFFETNVPRASADDVTTSVTVLNTPPTWTVDAEESPESSATTPTNSGSAVTWVATATDSSSDNYYLLICKTGAAPTANVGAAPSCGGGIGNQWAVSAATASGAQATAATTTIETFPFQNESNDWFAWVCDGNNPLARCNATSKQGTGSTASPFIVNHPPVFTAISNDGPVDPGDTVTWTATAYDTDTVGSADTVRLFICQTNGFNGTACTGTGWATSTLVSSNPATTTTITIPTQDALYAAYVFVVDNHGRTATSTFQAFNSSFTVSNVAPSVTAASISLEDTDGAGNLTLVTPSATTGPFRVRFTAADNNSCQSTGGDEFSAAITNVYRSGVGQNSCDAANEYNPNSCYAAASANFSPYLSCTQDASSCSGTTDTTATWTCTFPIWYVADPTDTATPWTGENWLASVIVTDDDSLSSTLTESSVGNEMTSFLAFNVTQTSIAFGGLEPGQQSSTLASTTDLIAIGNIGLDEDLYGDTMCTTWSAPDSCDTNGINAANDIPVSNQKFATSSVAYGATDAYTLTSSTSPASLEIRVQKTTATSSPQTKNTHWGINIPGTITQAGSYLGQNTITAKKSSSAFW
jgi:hypothetical protein